MAKFEVNPVWKSIHGTRRVNRFTRSWDKLVAEFDKRSQAQIDEMDAAWKQHDPAAKQLIHVKSE